MTIYNEAEQRKLKGKDVALYSEQYLVTYLVRGFDGIFRLQEVMYYAAGKNAHEQVVVRWLKEHPGAMFLSVAYQ